MSTANPAARAKPDKLLADIAAYVTGKNFGGRMARELARYCLMDSLGCAMAALETPDCVKLLGPVVPGMVTPHGARVPGTQLQLDPVTAAFNIGSLIRWHDFSDLWWNGGHPSDNIGGILATGDYLSRTRIAAGRKPLTMSDVMSAMIKAYEIHGVLSDKHTLNRPELGIDTVGLVKIATTAVVTRMLGGGRDEIVNAVSNAVVDGHPLNIYRTSGNAGSRKSWASGDATARAVWLAMVAMRGEMGYPHALTAKTWGFQEVLYEGRTLDFWRPLGSYVMENITFKISHPAQRSAQTAAECAVRLHPLVRHKLDDIERIELHTHAVAWRNINVTGPLRNFAARDHCLQYIVAAGLLDGDITRESYSDEYHAAHPRIDELRAKMVVMEDERYTRGYRDRSVRSNTNAARVVFKDGTRTPKVEIEYPIGNARRRKEGVPLLERKFEANLARRFPEKQRAAVSRLLRDQRALEATAVNEFTDLMAI